MRGLVWFRADLRVHDNTALYQATKQCDQGIIATYIIDTKMWQLHNTAACQIEFILSGLEQLQLECKKLNIPLIIIESNDTTAIPEDLDRLMTHILAQSLFFNKQYEVNESKRDIAVKQYLEQREKTVYCFDDQVILPPGSVLTQKREAFNVFTPYKNAWYKIFSETTIKVLPKPKKQAPLETNAHSINIPKSLPGFKSNIDATIWPAGENMAKKRLDSFIKNNIAHYDKLRDFPALDGTSQLSPYLATGMISPRQCFQAALFFNHHELTSGNKGAITWMTELIWREFYKHILVSKPQVSMNKAYQVATEKISWDFDETQFLAWQQGQTGYPIIDAAMRQLNTTGWMHNRLRMVVAMFLTKNLFFHWQLGEKYFMSHLIDGDLAANNGGWQWSASTGVDAAPYFRIFNPNRQSQRFDPEGTFIQKFCPELKDFNKKTIHEPYTHLPLIAAQSGYPKPIIGLHEKRLKVLKAFKSMK